MAYSSIVKPTDYFNTVTYTGNGGTNALTGVGFQPDFIWTKARSYNDDHLLVNSVTGNTAYLKSNSTNGDSSSSIRVTSFNSDGFTLGSSSDINGNTDTYVGWSWLGGGSASSNSDGSITSSVSVNTTAGLSIVSYTGNETASTIGHGLGVTPSMIIVKGRIAGRNWIVGHHTQGWTKSAMLDGTNAFSSQTHWNNTAPTSSVFTIEGGSDSNVNTNNAGYIAYCFADKKGYSKFGSYTANGNADGSFVYLGFKPAFVIVKRTDSSGDWVLFDNKRPSENPTDLNIAPNTNGAEIDEGQGFDFLSNGFKIREAGNFVNAGGQPFIYMAFAENPFVANDSGTAVPVVAR